VGSEGGKRGKRVDWCQRDDEEKEESERRDGEEERFPIYIREPSGHERRFGNFL